MIYEKTNEPKNYQITNGKSVYIANKEYTDKLLKRNSSQTTATNNPIINNNDIQQLADCQKLINTGKTQAEKDELQKDYWILLGALTKLDELRKLYRNTGDFINLFPDAYYYTTYTEMSLILANQYKYPIEKMNQMIAFYDSYISNRDAWDFGNKSSVEQHWRQHFEFCSSTPLGCINAGSVLATAITAHVNFDLARAINFAYINRFNKNLTYNDLQNDFYKTDAIFPATVEKTNHDVAAAYQTCSEVDLNWFSSNKTLATVAITINNLLTYIPYYSTIFSDKLFTSQDVISMRHQAWTDAQTKTSFKGIDDQLLKLQPLTDHNPLIAIGKNLCPLIPTADNQSFKILPEWVTHPTDKDFKWFDWDKAPEDLKIAANYINSYRNTNTKEIVTLRNQIDEDFNNDCYIQIAAIDLNEDGVCGLAIYASGQYCCGSDGCQFELYDNGGLIKSLYISQDNSLSKKIILDLKPNEQFIGDKSQAISLFKYDSKKASPALPVVQFTYYPFKMNSQYITHPTDGNFKWYTWGAGPGDIGHAAMDMFVNYDPNVTLANQLDSLVNNKVGIVQVAAIDLDNNGICGLAIKLKPNSNERSSFLICENGYLNSYYTLLTNNNIDPKPADFIKNIEVNKQFIGDKKKTLEFFKYDVINDNSTLPIVVDPNILTHCNTPEELAKTLLKALQTNNKNLWIRCINPTTEQQYRDAVTRNFDVVHKYFEESGISNWNLAKYDIVTYKKCAGCQPKDGATLLTDFVVEFLYKNSEFIGAFSITRILTYKGYYYMDGCRDCGEFFRRK